MKPKPQPQELQTASKPETTASLWHLRALRTIYGAESYMAGERFNNVIQFVDCWIRSVLCGGMSLTIRLYRRHTAYAAQLLFPSGRIHRP